MNHRPTLFSALVALSFVPMSLSPTSVLPTPEPICTVIEKIAEAKRELADISLSVGTQDYRYTEVRSNSPVQFKEPEKEIALALFNPAHCTLRTIVITKRGDQLIAPSGYTLMITQRTNGIRWNFWATDYDVVSPVGWFVIANKYPYTPQNKPVVNVVYVPYTEELDSPELIAAGEAYPTDIVQHAYGQLRTAGVMSRAYPHSLVTDVPLFDPAFLTRRMPIELIDLGEFLLDPAWTVRRQYAIIGANQQATSTYSCSPAAACGQWQFTAGTYQLMVRTYPSAHLIKDFVTGAQDPVNAAMAALLLDDYNLSVFKKNLKPVYFTQLSADPRILEESLDSAYNTGATRTIAVLNVYFKNQTKYTDWALARGTRSTEHLVAETQGYLAKLRYLRDNWPQTALAQAETKSPNK